MRNYEDWISAYMTYSQHSEAPDAFHFWVAVSVIAGALRRKVWINMGYFEWTPNFFIILVAPPGIVSKSTTADIGMRLLKNVEGIKFGPEALSWQKMVQSLAESCEGFMAPDGSIQRMSALTIVAGELGTLLNPQDREMVDAFVSLWDSRRGEWKKATKTQGEDIIISPWLNLLACTTPSWIAGAFPEYMIGGGFCSRTIFVYADKKRRLVAYPGRELPTDFKAMGAKLTEDLEHIAQLTGPITLTEDAMQWGQDWYEYHYSHRPAHLDNERFGGYIARKQTHIHKLAMVLSAAQSDSLVIEQHHLENATSIITELESDMPKIFGNIGNSKESVLAQDIYKYVANAGRIDRGELFKYAIRFMSWTQFKQIIESGVNAGVIKMMQEGSSIIIIAAGYKEPPSED